MQQDFKFKEENLEFVFGGNYWQCVIQYDKDDFYLKRVQKQHATKGSDFVGVAKNPQRLYLIEVKDFRIKHPDSFEILTDAVALKVKDTVAGLVGAHHTTGNEKWTLPVNGLLGSEQIRVVFLCELRGHPSPEKLLSLQSLLKKKLVWLTKRISVVNLNTYSQVLTNLTVANLSGAAQL